MQVFGSIPSKEPSAGCGLGIPAKVWELHPHPLWQRGLGSLWRCGVVGQEQLAPTRVLPALSRVSSGSHTAVYLAVPLPGLRQGTALSWSCCH